MFLSRRQTLAGLAATAAMPLLSSYAMAIAPLPPAPPPVPAVAPLSEDQAVRLVVKAMERLGPAAAKGCLAYEIEESSKARFDIAVREVHDQRCGGAPEVMPVIERFRIARRPVAVARYDVIYDRWLACRMRSGKPAC